MEAPFVDRLSEAMTSVSKGAGHARVLQLCESEGEVRVLEGVSNVQSAVQIVVTAV